MRQSSCCERPFINSNGTLNSCLHSFIMNVKHWCAATDSTMSFSPLCPIFISIECLYQGWLHPRPGSSPHKKGSTNRAKVKVFPILLERADLNLNFGLFIAIWKRLGAKQTAKLDAGIWLKSLQAAMSDRKNSKVFQDYWQYSILRCCLHDALETTLMGSTEIKNLSCKTSRFSSGKSKIADWSARKRYWGGTSMKIVVKVFDSRIVISGSGSSRKYILTFFG